MLCETNLAAVVVHQKGREVTAPWLMTVARNKIVDLWRKNQRDDRLIERMCSEHRVAVDPELPLADGEVGQTLGLLRARQRTMLSRQYVEGVSVGCLADENGVSYRAMESAMARSRRAFRESHVAC